MVPVLVGPTQNFPSALYPSARLREREAVIASRPRCITLRTASRFGAKYHMPYSFVDAARFCKRECKMHASETTKVRRAVSRLRDALRLVPLCPSDSGDGHRGRASKPAALSRRASIAGFAKNACKIRPFRTSAIWTARRSSSCKLCSAVCKSRGASKRYMG
jgi:hypothetical protein